MSDVTFAVNQQTFKEVFNKVYPSLKLPFDGSNVVGLIWFGVDGEIHIEGAGDIDFEDGNTFLLKELEIGWDKLILRLGFDIPTIKIGKFCLIRMPKDAPFAAGECLVEFPGAVLFSAEPDLGPVKLNLNAIVPYIVTEISGRYQIGIRKDGGYQKVYADPQAIDVDPISISDTFGKLPALVQAAVAAASAQLLKMVPEVWMVDIVMGFLGFPTASAYLLDLLDIHDDMEEWLMDVLNVSIGIDNLLYQVIFDEMLKKSELFKIENPYPFVPEKKNLKVADYGGFPAPAPGGPDFTMPEVAVPVLNASAEFDADHLFIRFDFGM